VGACELATSSMPLCGNGGIFGIGGIDGICDICDIGGIGGISGIEVEEFGSENVTGFRFLVVLAGSCLIESYGFRGWFGGLTRPGGSDIIYL